MSGTLTLDTAYDTIGDELVMRLAYDTTLPFSSNGNSHNDSNTICSRLADAIRWLLNMCRLSVIRKHIVTVVGNLTVFRMLRKPSYQSH